MFRSAPKILVLGVVGVGLIHCGPGTQPGPEGGGGGDGSMMMGNEASVGPDGMMMSGPDGDGPDATMMMMPDGMGGGNEGGAMEAGMEAGTPMMDCAAVAQRTCMRMQMCTPLVFERAYENMTLCVSALSQNCMGGTPLPEDNGLVDAAACATALDSCPAYIASLQAAGSGPPTVPAACQRRRGTRSSMLSGTGRSCGADFQCVAGEYCYGVTMAPICADGNCSRPDRLLVGGNICQNASKDPCDTEMNQRCTRQYDMMAMDRISTDTVGSRYTCRQIMYGTSGAPCAATTDRQCAAGFVCSTTTFTCVSLLGMGEPCDGNNANRCDSRLGLTCQQVPNTMGRTCRPAPFARIGAQCGMVTEGGVTENRQCAAAVAFCNSATPTVCEALKGMGDACVNTPRDNCRPPFTCRSGTCQPPMATMCR